MENLNFSVKNNPIFESKYKSFNLPDELKKYLPRFDEFIKDNRTALNSIIGDHSLNYAPADGASFNHREGIVNLDLKDWKNIDEYNLPEDSVKFTVFHELGHFQDLRKDPKGYLECFKYKIKKAKELAPEIIKIWQEKFPDGKLPDYITATVGRDGDDESSFVEYFAHSKLHWMYNIIDDIYVNNRIGVHVSSFDKGGSSRELLKKIYRDFLFPAVQEEKEPKENQAVDYRHFPKVLQFTYYLLRKKMVPDQEILIDPSILKKLSEPLKRGSDLSLNSWINYIVQNSHENKDNMPSYRYSLIQKIVEPYFIQLLLEDCHEIDLPREEDFKEQKSGSGQGGKKSGSAVQPKGQPDQNNDQSGETGEKESDQDKSDEQESESGGQSSGSKSDESRQNDSEQNGQSGKKDNQDSKGKENNGQGSNQSGPKTWSEPPFKYDPGKSFDEKTIRDFLTAKESRDQESEEEKKVEEKAKDMKAEDFQNMEEKEAKTIDQLSQKKPDLLDEQQKNSLRQRLNDIDFSKKYDIPDEAIAEYNKIAKNIEPLKKEIAVIFEKMMADLDYHIEEEWEKWFQSGKFSVKEFIRKYGKYLQDGAIENLNPEEIRAYKKKEFISMISLLPNNIRVRFVFDGSGSMSWPADFGDFDRSDIVKMIATLFFESFNTAEQKIKNKYGQKIPVTIDTEVWMFGTDALRVKPFYQDIGQNVYNDEYRRAQNIKSFSAINSNYGLTHSHLAWEEIDQSIDNNYLEKVKKGEINEFIIEVTDGGNNGGKENCQLQNRIIKKLSEAGITTLGLQVGNPGEEEKDIFKTIWENKGQEIGNFKDLVPFLLDQFKEKMKKVKLKAAILGKEI